MTEMIGGGAVGHRMPSGLAGRGERLWLSVLALEDFDLDPAQVLILEEACRMADRLDELDAVIRDGEVELSMKALVEARQQQNVFKQLLVALRLPDVNGVRPQKRGARGAYAPKGPTPADELAAMRGRHAGRGA